MSSIKSDMTPADAAAGTPEPAAVETAEAATSSSPCFSVGDIVTIKRHGKARIITGVVSDPADQYRGRCQVQYLADGKTYWARPESMRVYHKPPARVLVCETTKHYRSAALLYAHPDDIILEVGCHEGVTTDILHSRCKWVLGIDLNWDPVARARAKYPHCHFEVVDGFDVDKLRSMSPTGNYDKILIDIGGIAELHTLMSMVGLYYKTFNKATLVVKNKYFKNLLGNTQVHVPQVELDQRKATKQEQQQTTQEAAEHVSGDEQQPQQQIQQLQQL
eukprot:GHUV01005943.1.p1 GENE.GHUV01005943.1~~GHUV01005943.1.p1  ORF type:complete len:276 (+),score=73.78 GHUV01005943.1:223-1050(+)